MKNQKQKFKTSISPEALNFVKTQGKTVLKDLQKFLEKLKDSEFYNNEEDDNYSVVRSEITSFLNIFDKSTDEDVRKYYTVTSGVYELLK